MNDDKPTVYDPAYPTRNHVERQRMRLARNLVQSGLLNESEVKELISLAQETARKCEDPRAANTALKMLFEHFHWSVEYESPKVQKVDLDHHFPSVIEIVTGRSPFDVVVESELEDGYDDDESDGD